VNGIHSFKGDNVKQKRGKMVPTNKDRDAALSHMLGRLNYLEQLLNAQIEVFEQYTHHRKTYKKFQKYMTKEMEKRNEEQRILDEDGPALSEDKENEGRRTERVREEV